MARLKKLLPLCLALAALAAPGTGMADPWKDESGKGSDRRERGWDQRGWDHRGERRDDRRERDRWEHRDRRDDHRGDRRHDRRGYGYHPPPYAPPPIASGHLPPLGEYRLWFPDRPPGHQPPPERW